MDKLEMYALLVYLSDVGQSCCHDWLGSNFVLIFEEIQKVIGVKVHYFLNIFYFFFFFLELRNTYENTFILVA